MGIGRSPATRSAVNSDPEVPALEPWDRPFVPSASTSASVLACALT